MNHTLRSTLTLPLLLGPLAAQAIVSPQPFANAEGRYSTIVPLSSPFNPPLRMLQVHDDLMGTPRVIHGMRFRREGVNPWPATAASSVIVSVTLSEAATTAGTVSPIFAANHGAGQAPVFSGFLPIAAAGPQSLPEPFVIEIPFSASFSYPGNAPLCWDLQVTGSTNTNYAEVDAAGGSDSNPDPARRYFGTGCTLSGNTQPMSLSGGTSNHWPSNPASITFSYSGLNFAQNTSFPNPGSFALLGFGVALLSSPITIPGSACDLIIDPLMTEAVFISPNGTFAGGSHLFSLPVQPAFNGLDLAAQAFTQDPVTGAIAASNACQFNLVAPYASVAVGSVIGNGVGGQTMGTATTHFGAIVEFY